MKTGKKAEFLDPSNHEFHLEDSSRIYSGPYAQSKTQKSWYRSRTLHFIVLDVIVLVIVFFSANYFKNMALPKVVFSGYSYELKAYSLGDKVRVYVNIESAGGNRAGSEVAILFLCDDGQSVQYEAVLPNPEEGAVTVRHVFVSPGAKKVNMLVRDGTEEKKVAVKIIYE
jgi:hypothetical protein